MTGFGGFGHVSTEGADGVDAFGLEGDVGLGFFGRWGHGVGVLECLKDFFYVFCIQKIFYFLYFTWIFWVCVSFFVCNVQCVAGSSVRFSFSILLT